jgi:TetR/AcrR family transcriptional repressor of nem operon
MTAKAEKKERSHAGIVASAARLLREKGIAGARVADVMAGAGLTVGGFYAHFPSKEALVDEALRRTASAMRARLVERLDAKPERERIAIVLKRYLSVAHRDEAAKGCPFPAVVGEIGTSAPQHAPVLAEQIGEVAELLETQLPRDAATREGAPSPRQLALGLVALMVGGLALSRALRGSALSEEVLRASRTLGVFAARGDGSR